MSLSQNLPAAFVTPAIPVRSGVSVTKSQAPTSSTLTSYSSASSAHTSKHEAVAIGCGLGIYAAMQLNRRPQVQPRKAFENELGVQAPVGFWDPAGYTVDGDQELFTRRRETEIKHGRVAMLAALGYIVPEYTRFPGSLSPSQGLDFTSVPNGLAALSQVPGSGWLQIFLFLGLMETAWIPIDPSRAPGDRERCGVLGVPNGAGAMKDDALRQKKLSAELANGRLAMMAIIGMFFQDGLTGSAWGDWANYTASPFRAFENELGVQAPVGFWDPLGYTADGNLENFARRRQTELKHGRIAMLATMGYITPEITGKFSGFLSPSKGLRFEDIPNGLAAVSKVPASGWAQVIAYCAYCEVSQDQSPGTPASKGEFGFTVLTASDPAEKAKKLSAELANGRLAMMAIIGMFFQDGLTGSAWGDWAAYTDSPLRAFENELGVQEPVGFWDPAGFTSDGDMANFKRRRSVELKHGRICMLATMGYITPEVIGKLPGYLSPSAGLKFADIPNGLAAISKVPTLGWAQIAAYFGFVEFSGGFADYKTGTPGDYGWKVLTSSDPAEKTKKLSAEIANSRLAMVAIIGMFFQDGLTGSAWGDWAAYTDSPLRAQSDGGLGAARPDWGKPFGEGPFDPMKQVGALPPLGYWDPAGFTKDEASFRQYRTAEIKHGRVAMTALIGLVVAHDNHFAWIPDSAGAGARAFETPEAGQGLAYLVLVAGYFELKLWTEDQSKAPGNFDDPAGWTLTFPSLEYDEDLRNKELNNGRFGMLAVIGVLVAEQATGLDPVEQINYAIERWSNMGGFENF